MFCWSRHVRRVSLRTDTWYFSGSCLVKRHVMFYWNGHLRAHIMFGTSITITQQTVDYVLALVHLAGLCWASLMMLLHWFALLSLLIFACCDFIERNTPKNFWWHSGCSLPLQQTHGWLAGLEVSSGSSHCWFIVGTLLVDLTTDDED